MRLRLQIAYRFLNSLTLSIFIVSNRRKEVSYKGAILPYVETHDPLPADVWSPKNFISIDFLFKWIMVVAPQLAWKPDIHQMILLTVINTVEAL